MAPHSSTLAWKIPWMEEPGGLQSMGSRRVGHGWVTSLSLFTFMHWRRKWQPTPVFLLGESQGRGSLVGCRLWGRTVGHNWRDLAAAAAKLLEAVAGRWRRRKWYDNKSLIFLPSEFCFDNYCISPPKLYHWWPSPVALALSLSYGPIPPTVPQL